MSVVCFLILSLCFISPPNGFSAQQFQTYYLGEEFFPVYLSDENYTNEEVSLAKDGKGDALIFPLYIADETFQTKIRIKNTYQNLSAVAKINIRSQLYDQNTLCFFTFLSPGDEWDGYLRWENGRVIIYSENDSIVAHLSSQGKPVFASPENPASHALIEICDDSNRIGHVQVFLSYVFPDDYKHPNTGNQINLTGDDVLKEDIHHAFIGNSGVWSPSPYVGGTPGSFTQSYNILEGSLQIQKQGSVWSNKLNALALKDYRLYKIVGLSETPLGYGSKKNLLHIESTLANNNIRMPVSNHGTIHWFVFPTKMPLINHSDCKITGWQGLYAGFEGIEYNPVMDAWGSVIVRYQDTISNQTNLHEKTINFIEAGKISENWAEYRFSEGPTHGHNYYGEPISYSGVPVIPLIMNFTPDFSIKYGIDDNLQVFINPQKAVDAGAQWRRTGTTAWHNSGYTEANIPVGMHTIEFKDISAWITPENQVVTVEEGNTTKATGTYSLKSSLNDLEKANTIFNWLESEFPEILSPTPQPTYETDGIYFRYYPGTNVYLGTIQNDLYFYDHLGVLHNLGSVDTWLPFAQTNPYNVVQDIDFYPNHLAGVNINTWVESNEIGVVVDAPIGISAGGEYKINNASWTSENGEVKIGDKVRIRLKSSTHPYTSVRTTLYIGSSSGIFIVTTAPRNKPPVFDF